MFIAHQKYAHTHLMEVSKNKSILLTNTRPPTSGEIAFWARFGYTVHHQALLSVRLLPVNQLDVDPQAIVLTSANGALALEHSDWDRSIPVYGVGIATATTAKSVGFIECSSPSDKPYPSALNLINWIKNNLDPQDGVIVFGCGEHLRHDIAEELSKFGFQMLKILLYKTEQVEKFTAEIARALKNRNIGSVAINSEQVIKAFTTLCQKSDIAFKDFNIVVSGEFLKNCAIQLGYVKIFVVQQNHQTRNKQQKFIDKQ
jgi:uroporphyrinogen-III synthase